MSDNVINVTDNVNNVCDNVINVCTHSVIQSSRDIRRMCPRTARSLGRCIPFLLSQSSVFVYRNYDRGGKKENMYFAFLFLYSSEESFNKVYLFWFSMDPSP